MNYYEVIVASSSFYGVSPLTYMHSNDLSLGQLVIVPLKNHSIVGTVISKVPKPKFEVKPIETILDLPSLPKASIDLMSWLQAYYPSPIGIIGQLFMPKSLAKNNLDFTSTHQTYDQPIEPLPDLTNEQQQVIKAIDRSGSFLLHGETGSGKTRVYLELSKQALDNNKSALILTPEINLTSQLISTFTNFLQAPILVIHSRLTQTERLKIWLAILYSDKPLVLIGARSALFTPISKLGLIVVDESHEGAYKQEQSPNYQAQRVASKLAEIHKAKLISGSATPAISEYFAFQAKKLPILRMKSLAKSTRTKTDIDVIDLKDHQQFSQSPNISDKLISKIKTTLSHKQQCLLFLNRRGTARIVICNQCGWQAVCPHCDLPLIYHDDKHKLRCHICSYTTNTPTNCPVCKCTNIIFRGVGTKAIVGELKHHFPDANIQRFDTDNTKDEQFINHFEAVKSGKIDIIVGTQALAKGLDLPNLGLIGVIIADTSLYLPDYTANEKTYQLLYQVLGRIGRGHIEGCAVIQTYDQDNIIIQSAIRHDWDTFYNHELEERRQFLFPPFCFLLKLTCRRAKSSTAQYSAEKLIELIKKLPLKMEIVGPSPSFHKKISGKFQWQIIIKAKDRGNLLKVINILPSGWSYDLDPIDLL